MENRLYIGTTVAIWLSIAILMIFNFLILQAIIGTLIIGVFSVGGLKIKHWNDRNTMEIKRQEAEVDLMRKDVDIMTVTAGSNIAICTKDPAWKIDNFQGRGTGTYLNREPSGVEMVGNVRPCLMDAMQGEQQVWIVGGQKSGKTTLMNHMLDMFTPADTSQLVFDSHDHLNKWPASAQVIGGQRKYEQIETGLNKILNEIKTRYGTYYKDHEHFESVSDRLIADEWSMVPDEIPETVKKFVKPFFTEGRKVGFHFLMATHNDDVETTGFWKKKSMWQKIENRVYLHNHGGDRFAYLLRSGETEKQAKQAGIKYELPGKYYPRNRFDPFKTPDPEPKKEKILQGLPAPYPRQPSEQRQKIFNCILAAGKISPAKISKQTGLKKTYVRQTLAKMLKTGCIRKNGFGVYSI